MFWLWRPGRASRASAKPGAAARIAAPMLGQTSVRSSALLHQAKPEMHAEEPASRDHARAARPDHHPEPRMRVPITLGVAVLLQVLGLAFACVVGALLYFRAQLDEHEQASGVERRLAAQLSQASAAAQSASVDLESAKRALREQREELHRLQSKLAELEQAQSSLEAKPRTRAGHKGR